MRKNNNLTVTNTFSYLVGGMSFKIILNILLKVKKLKRNHNSDYAYIILHNITNIFDFLKITVLNRNHISELRYPRGLL